MGRNPKVKKSFEERIATGREKKYRYLLPNNDSVNYFPPIITDLIRELSWDAPFIPVAAPEYKQIEFNKDRHPSIYYIPKDINKRLLELFGNFHIPEELRNDLIWAYLNMYFASGKIELENLTFAKQKKIERGLYEAVEFLLKLKNENIKLNEITLTYQSKGLESDTNHPFVDKVKISSDLALEFIQKVLINYENLPDPKAEDFGLARLEIASHITNKGFYMYKRSYEQYKEGTKEKEKNSIHYRSKESKQEKYAWELLKYLQATRSKKNLFNSDNKLKEFIGELMSLSGLQDDNSIKTKSFIKNRLKLRIQYQSGKLKGSKLERFKKTILQRSIAIHPKF